MGGPDLQAASEVEERGISLVGKSSKFVKYALIMGSIKIELNCRSSRWCSEN
jgi:hypothetical protein